MSKKNERRGTAFAKKPCVIATEIAIAMMTAQFAYAQQVAQAERVERVEITGTRIPQLNVEGVSPITVLNAQDIKLDGLAKPEDLLNVLPAVTPSYGSNIANGATGTATVSLRGLGVTRNLVLVNGRRLPPGSPGYGASDGYAADLNQIPTPLIQRVEVLTGGASAVYGSDAISGVVNFIMNDKFEGLQIDVNHSFYNHRQQNPQGTADAVRASANPAPGVVNPLFVVPGNVASDGDIHNISLLMGKNFADNKGNATLFFSYKVEDPLLQAARDFSACSLGGGDAFACIGSSTGSTGRFTFGDGVRRTVADAAGNLRPFTNADTFNFGPYNHFRRPSEQYGFNAFAHLDVAPSLRAYGEFGFHDNHTISQIAPSGIFGELGTVDFSNPLLSADARAQIAAHNFDPNGVLLPFAAPGDTASIVFQRRNVEGGGRQDDIRHTSFRWVLGMKGDILTHWNYDLFLQTGKVIYQNQYNNDFSKTRVKRALNVVPDNRVGSATFGQAVCQSVLDGSDPNCVPWDLWHIGGVTGAAVGYLSTPGLKNGYTQQQVQGGTLSADLGNYGWRLPTAKNGVGLVVGAERRKEALVLNTDLAFSSFDLAGQGGPIPPVSGKVTATDVFGEVRVPLIEGRQFADLLSVNGSYRRSRYSTGVTTNTYGLGAEWAPVRSFRFRGSYQHAIRAANILELFQAQGNQLFGLAADPCGSSDGAGGAPSATFVQCQRTGVTLAQYGSDALFNSANQYNYVTGGNPNLSPETSDSYTAGLVFTPTQNLTGSIDWWSIKIKDAVAYGTTLAPAILTSCLNSGQQCNLIHRDAFGTLWLLPAGGIDAFNANAGGYHLTGVDLAASYLLRLGRYGSLNLSGTGSWSPKWEFEPFKGQGKYDCAGLFGINCGVPLPKWRHKVRATWTTPWNLDLAFTWRHIGSTKAEGTSGNPLLAAAVSPSDEKLDKRDYLDIAASWTVDKSLTLRAGVNNVFDKDPPIASGDVLPVGFGNGNTFPQMYDTLGRLVFIGATLKW